MVGVLLITHATLGDALIECVCHVLNRRPPNLQALAVMPQDDPRDGDYPRDRGRSARGLLSYNFV